MTLKSLEETFTSARVGVNTQIFAGNFNISVVVPSGTLNIERSFNNGQTWLVVDAITSNTEDAMSDPEGALYRFNCTGFTTGPIYGRLGQ